LMLLFALLISAPLSYAWILPHQVSYQAPPGSSIRACATVVLDHNSTVSLTCGQRLIGEANVVAGAPAVLCYTVPVSSSTSCVWSDGKDAEKIFIHEDHSTIVDAALAVLLIVLVVRFTVKLVKIYI